MHFLAVPLEIDSDVLLKILGALLTCLIALAGWAVRITWQIANLLRDLRDELAQIRNQLSAGEEEFTRLHATIWTRHNMERWAAALDKANPEIDVPDPHDEQWRYRSDTQTLACVLHFR
jgi:uncharacterized membrane protein YccC